jgi:hypothetical protein
MPGKAPEFDSSPDMGGFTISFFLPFVADDLYNELLSEFPLGSSPNVTFTILRSGYSGPVISPGCVRKVTFPAPYFGETISELTVAEKGTAGSKSTIVWRQLTSSTRLNLLGRDGIPPEYIVTLEGSTGGTLVRIRYNFHKTDMKGPLFFLSYCMPSLLQFQLSLTIVDVWHAEMVRRQHLPQEKPTFIDLPGDKSEEKSIRLKALQQPTHPCARCLGGGASERNH